MRALVYQSGDNRVVSAGLRLSSVKHEGINSGHRIFTVLRVGIDP